MLYVKIIGEWVKHIFFNYSSQFNTVRADLIKVLKIQLVVHLGEPNNKKKLINNAGFALALSC